VSVRRVFLDLVDIRRNAILRRDLLLRIRVDLDERNMVCARELGRELLKDGSDLLARTTPVSINYLRSVVA
jgi:hypothetical protein